MGDLKKKHTFLCGAPRQEIVREIIRGDQDPVI
jgi:hypothetical protein